MGERYVTIAFGVQDHPDSPYCWSNWLDNLLYKGLHNAQLVKLRPYGKGILLPGQTEPLKIDTSYEAKPRWAGIQMWSKGEDNVSLPLEAILERRALAEEAWKTLCSIIKTETGIDMPPGKLIVACDHT